MRAGRVDANQNEIVAVFRQLGCSVAITSNVRGGFPDIVVGVNGLNLLVEIKDGSKVPSARKLTDDEQRFHDNWKGRAVVVESVDDVVALVNGIQRKAA
jgi:Holliday junction resolvase